MVLLNKTDQIIKERVKDLPNPDNEIVNLRYGLYKALKEVPPVEKEARWTDWLVSHSKIDEEELRKDINDTIVSAKHALGSLGKTLADEAGVPLDQVPIREVDELFESYTQKNSGDGEKQFAEDLKDLYQMRLLAGKNASSATDIIRTLALYTEGGVYADNDMLPAIKSEILTKVQALLKKEKDLQQDPLLIDFFKRYQERKEAMIAAERNPERRSLIQQLEPDASELAIQAYVSSSYCNWFKNTIKVGEPSPGAAATLPQSKLLEEMDKIFKDSHLNSFEDVFVPFPEMSSPQNTFLTRGDNINVMASQAESPSIKLFLHQQYLNMAYQREFEDAFHKHVEKNDLRLVTAEDAMIERMLFFSESFSKSHQHPLDGYLEQSVSIRNHKPLFDDSIAISPYDGIVEGLGQHYQ